MIRRTSEVVSELTGRYREVAMALLAKGHGMLVRTDRVADMVGIKASNASVILSKLKGMGVVISMKDSNSNMCLWKIPEFVQEVNSKKPTSNGKRNPNAGKVIWPVVAMPKSGGGDAPKSDPPEGTALSKIMWHLEQIAELVPQVQDDLNLLTKLKEWQQGKNKH